MTTQPTMSRKAIATPHARNFVTPDAHDRQPSGPTAVPDRAVRSESKPAPRNWRRWWALFAILPFVTSVAGCGLLAAPCRVASAGLKIIPGIGGVLAAPTDACAAAIN
ncbi:lipoprotein [Pandoraea anhela]|uniref:Lipoprotein n=1 Tax=Pandoraea anhela TaxID=2508295 RepID=A0A5E4SJ50_9BURK|nr:DUF6726 family protein [Pandoraea anhela]VVD74464.1 lipoprotein [Pandoraea anhela]